MENKHFVTMIVQWRNINGTFCEANGNCKSLLKHKQDNHRNLLFDTYNVVALLIEKNPVCSKGYFLQT